MTGFSSIKEQIVRELVDLLQRSPDGRKMDLGSLVVYLDDEVPAWIHGQTMYTKPLFDYCQQFTGWTPEQFVRLMSPLETRLSAYRIVLEFGDAPEYDEDAEGTMIQSAPFGGMAAMAAAMVTGNVSAPPPTSEHTGFSDKEAEFLINLILSCTSKTPVEEIIDPEKLRGFLEETIHEMWDDGNCNLQMLWDILLDAPGVSEDMLIPAFLLMELKESKIPLLLPSLVQKLPQKMRQSLLAPYGVQLPGGGASADAGASAASKPAAVTTDSNRFMMQRTSEKPPRPPAASAPPAPAASKPPKQERPASKKAAAPTGASRSPRSSTASIPSAGKLQKGGGIPAWVWIVAVTTVVVAGLYYFLFLYKPKTVFRGQVIAASEYQKVFPASEIRLDGRELLVRITPQYLALPEAKRLLKAQELWEKMRLKRTIYSMILFDPEGKIIQKFGSR